MGDRRMSASSTGRRHSGEDGLRAEQAYEMIQFVGKEDVPPVSTRTLRYDL